MSELQTSPDGCPAPSRRGHKPRKQRRKSWRQARDCEMGVPFAPTNRWGCRCACKGSRRGWKRCNPIAATRWDFAQLPPDDPHYIPPQRRRISPRMARRVHKHVAAYVAKMPPGPDKREAQDQLRIATLAVALWVQAERVHARVRRYRRQVRSESTEDWQVWKFNRRTRQVEVRAWSAREFVERCRNRMLSWIRGKGDWPPGYSPGPAPDAYAGSMSVAVLADLALQQDREKEV